MIRNTETQQCKDVRKLWEGGGECKQRSVIHDIMSAARNSEATEHPNNYEKTEFLRENKTYIRTKRLTGFTPAL